MKAPIANPCIFIKPSVKLDKFINALKPSSDMPLGILNLRSKKTLASNNRQPIEHQYLLTKTDISYINSLNLIAREDVQFGFGMQVEDQKNNKLLHLQDVHWLYNRIHDENKNKEQESKIYFHELFEGSEVVLPENVDLPRNEELEKRCQKLKNQQDNRAYKAMTKNVDSVRKRHPEDTISYQIKQLNRYLIAIAQFVISVFTGFAFGFTGIELLVGTLDFGFRLLLGVICGLIIALAELYFLAKKLNEDMYVEQETLHSKLD